MTMTLRVEITERDYKSFLFYYLFFIRLRKRLLMYTVLGLAVVLWQTTGELHLQGEDLLLLYLLGPVITIVAGALATLLTGLISAAVYLKKNRSHLGWQTYTIDENEFRQEAENYSSSVKWKTLVKLKETRNYYFLFVTPVSAYIIPKRNFSSPGEENQFIDTLKRYLS